MIQEMTMKEALKKFAAGRQVLLMATVEMPDGSKRYPVTDLADMLQDARFLVDVPAAIDREFDAAFQSPPNAGEEKATVKRPQRKWYLNDEDKKLVAELYKAGEEMEAIADSLNFGLTAVSRYIHESGLGDERHKGKPIPNSGSAAIPSATVNGSTGKKR